MTPGDELALHNLQAAIFADHIINKGHWGKRTHAELAEVAGVHPMTIQKIIEGETRWPTARTERLIYGAVGIRRDFTVIATGKPIDLTKYHRYIPSKFR